MQNNATIIDATDKKLLGALQDNARLTSGELATLAHLSQSPSWRRVRRLEEGGIIEGYHARLDRKALGYGVLAFVMVGIDHQNDTSSAEFERAVLAIPEVVLFHGISGPEEFVLVVVDDQRQRGERDDGEDGRAVRGVFGAAAKQAAPAARRASRAHAFFAAGVQGVAGELAHTRMTGMKGRHDDRQRAARLRPRGPAAGIP